MTRSRHPGPLPLGAGEGGGESSEAGELVGDRVFLLMAGRAGADGEGPEGWDFRESIMLVRPDMGDADRRRFPRADAEIACKLRRDARALFTPGRTTNVSCGGAALELSGPRRAEVGERVAVAFEHAACPVTRSVQMVTGTVVRAGLSLNGVQRVALAFDVPQMGLEALERRGAA